MTDNEVEQLSLEIQRFSMEALELAKRVVSGLAGGEEKSRAATLQEQLPVLAAKARNLPDDNRESAMRALADARLDLAFVDANGGIPSSIRLAHFIADLTGTDRR